MQITYYPAGSNPAPQSPSPPLHEAVVAESDKLPQSPLPQGQDFVVTNLDKLPVELLEMIVLDLDDLGDLYSLVTAYTRAHYLYLSDPQGVASKILTSSNVGGHQIRSLLLSIWLSQQSQSYVPGSRIPNEAHEILHQPAIDNLLTQFYTMGDQDIKHRLAILMGTMGPIAFLKEATSITQNITEAEESLISTMLRKANAEIESVMKTRQQRDISIRQDKMKGVRGDTEYLSTFSSIKSPTTRTPAGVAEQSRLEYPFSKVPPSSTEVHRIRRAFWRLWLFFELYHHAGQPPGRRYVRVDPDSYPQGFGPVDFFFSPLALWEHEEMECAYYHLCYQSFLWRRQCPHCWRFFLPDILTKHLSEYDWLPTAQKPSYTIQPDQLWTVKR